MTVTLVYSSARDVYSHAHGEGWSAVRRRVLRAVTRIPGPVTVELIAAFCAGIPDRVLDVTLAELVADGALKSKTIAGRWSVIVTYTAAAATDTRKAA